MGVGQAGDPLGRGGGQDPGGPWLAAVISRPVARWVLPVPGGPSSTTLRASARNPPEARAAICWRKAGLR